MSTIIYTFNSLNPLIVMNRKIISTVLFLLYLYGWNFAIKAKVKTNTSAAAGRYKQ